MQPLVVLISTFTLIFVACNASLPSAELYWNSVLPNTPMPKTIQDRLMSGLFSSINFFQRIDYVTPPSRTLIDMLLIDWTHKQSRIFSSTFWSHSLRNFSASHPSQNYPNSRSVEDWGVNKIHPDLCAFYIFFPLCIGSNVKAQDDPRRYIFLTENDLKLGTKKSLYLMKSSNRANFLPQKVNDIDPSTSKNIIATIDLLLSQPNSLEAKDMKNTINMCEESSSVEEDDSCATTLEEMVEFTTSRLGNNVETVISEGDTEDKIQSYSISELKNMLSEKSIVCHKLTYPYAVYKCHSMSDTRAYRVSVVNINRKKINVGVICHLDTSRWNPEHLAFDVLNVKPGTTPVCHIVPGDSIAWVPK